MISTKDYSTIVDSAKTQALIDTQMIEEKLKDNNLNITIEVKEHENLDRLTTEQIEELKRKGSL
jgi:hypothetical protein